MQNILDKKELSERDKSLLDKAKNILINNIADSEEFPWHPYRCIKPSPMFDGIWNWDSAFHAIGVLNWDDKLAEEQILGFIQYQCENGMFPDVKVINGDINIGSSKPPVLSTAAVRIFEKNHDLEFLKKVYPSFVKNEKFWTELRMYKGLFHYDADTNVVPFEKYELNAGWESGWDNSVRWDKHITDLWTIDLNCYMVMHYRALAFMAKELGFFTEEAVWKCKEKVLTDNIEEKLWDDKNKVYVDVNRFTGEYSDVLSPASFMPLYIHIAPKDRAECMAKLGGDKNKFYPGMPTVAYDNPQFSEGYWRGLTWLNVAYFAAKGLKDYGFDSIADGIKETILGWVEADDTIHENYNSKTGEGTHSHDFSWSSVFVMRFILDF